MADAEIVTDNDLDPRVNRTSSVNKPFEITPSTELIPDEYQACDKSGVVYIFRGTSSNDHDDTMELLNTLEQDFKFEIPSDNIVAIDSKKDVSLKLKNSKL